MVKAKEKYRYEIWQLAANPRALSGAVKLDEGESNVDPDTLQAELHRAGKRDHIVIDPTRRRPLLWS